MYIPPKKQLNSQCHLFQVGMPPYAPQNTMNSSLLLQIVMDIPITCSGNKPCTLKDARDGNSQQGFPPSDLWTRSRSQEPTPWRRALAWRLWPLPPRPWKAGPDFHMDRGSTNFSRGFRDLFQQVWVKRFPQVFVNVFSACLK